MVLRGDDPISISIDVRGTALDVLANTEHLVVAGSNSLSVLTVGSTCANTWIKLRSNRQLVRLLKFNPLSTGYFSSVSGQFIDLYSLGQGSHIHRLATFTAHARKISDFCWCPFNDQFMITCAENDSVNFWDLRTNLRTPTARLGVTFGAGQSKFSPHLNNYLLTTHGTDIRLWDLRHTSQPVLQFKAHQAKVFCLDWHPHHREPNSFFTSANDSTLKLWNMADQKSTPSMISMAPFCAWRLVFSHEGEELAALGLPPLNALALYSNYGLENPRLLKGIERDTLMDAAWHKSITYQKSTTKFLYTLSAVKQKLCRHPIAYELSNIQRDEMATPITQSKTDEERDRLVEQTIGPELMQMASGSLDEVIDDRGVDQQQWISTTTNARSSANERSTLFGSVKNAQPPPTMTMMMDGGGGGGIPQSPIYSEWQRWIRAPNMAGGDLLTELEALRKHSTEGLYTTEVNFTRAAIGFSYMHLNKFNKINFEMRFHREFIDNGLVFVEVIQKESPFTPEKTSLFLTLLQQESDIQQKIPDNQTILCRILQRLPRIIDLMKVFSPSIDVPPSSQSKTSSQSGSASEDQQMSSSTFANPIVDPFGGSNFVPTTSNRTISVAVPCSYLPSPFDHRVPSPRNCGARFNRSGFLVLFGPMNTILWTKDGQMNDFYGEGIPRIAPPMKGGRKAGGIAFGRFGSTRSQPSEATRIHPRSLAEYCVFVNPPINLRQTSSISGVLPFQSSPPLHCISPANAPNRPTSPNNRFPQQQSESIAIFNRQNQQQHNNNSLSPPSLLLPQSQQYSYSTAEQTKPIVGSSRVLGSSPTSSSAVRSFSLQNVANSIRHRGSSMSGAIPPSSSITSPQSIIPMSTIEQQQQSSSPQRSFNINIPLFQQQSMIEYSTSSMPAAVMPEQSFNSVVVVYDATALLPLSQNLAKTYKLLGSSPIQICQHNFHQAAAEGREDLMEMWKLVEQCIRIITPLGPIPMPKMYDRMKNFARIFRLNDQTKLAHSIEKYTSMDIPWAIHPLGREVVNRLIEHFANKFDLQSAALIICVLSQLNNAKREYFPKGNQNQPFIKRPISSDRISTKLNADEAIPPQMTSLDVRIPLPPLNIAPTSRKTSSTLNRPFVIDNFGSARSKQSMDRLSPAPEHFSSTIPCSKMTIHYPLPQKEANSEMFLDPILLSTRFEELKKKYADILYRWRMYKKSTEVLKFCKTEGEEAKIGIIKAINWCSICGRQLNEGTAGCIVCRCPAIYCSICEQPCKGIISMCNSCGHGGHFIHLASWFNSQSQCPLGCGCECNF